MNPLELYLQRVDRELRSMPAAKREDELRELSSHLEQRVEDFEAQGLSPLQAQRHTLDEFGAPKALGSKLYDAWEGVPFSIGRLLGALLGVTFVWFSGSFALSFGVIRAYLWDRSVLFPELPYCFVLALTMLPFCCGWLFSHWLGRRGRLVTLLYFTWAILSVNIVGIPVQMTTTGNVFSIPLPIFNAVLAFAGAVVGHTLRRRRQRLALASGQIWNLSAGRTLYWRSRGLTVCALLIVGLLLYLRVETALHPTTPLGVLRASLLSERGMNPGDFETPTILEMHELPATTPAEMAGREKRVEFQVETHATEQYAKRRVRYLKQLLAQLPADRKRLDEKPLRLSLARLQENSHLVQGTVRLIKTPEGWQVDETDFDGSQLTAWCYDIYFER